MRIINNQDENAEWSQDLKMKDILAGDDKQFRGFAIATKKQSKKINWKGIAREPEAV